MMPTDGPEHRPNSGGRSGQRVTIQVCRKRNRPPFFVETGMHVRKPQKFRLRRSPWRHIATFLSLDAVRKVLLHGALRHRKDAGQNLAYPPTNSEENCLYALSRLSSPER